MEPVWNRNDMRYHQTENVPASRKVAFAACFRSRKIGAQVISLPTSDEALTLSTQLPHLPPQLRRLRQAVFFPLQHIREYVSHMARQRPPLSACPAPSKNISRECDKCHSAPEQESVQFRQALPPHRSLKIAASRLARSHK